MSNEVLAIQFDVWISGTKITGDKKSCITSIDIKETVDGSDSATLKISDPEFQYINDNIFLEENTIEMHLGWDVSTYRLAFKGYISAVDIEFPENGVPNLTITCMDETHKMNRAKKNNTYTNCTSADVVKRVVQSYGYTCVIESGYNFTVQETISQSDQTDADFLQKLAGDEVYPFTARLSNGVFYYVKKGHLGNPKMTLRYRKYPHEIMSFSPKINKESKKQEISSSKVNTSTKSTSTTKGTSSSSSGSVSSGGNSNSSNSSSSKSGTSYTYDPSKGKWNRR